MNEKAFVLAALAVVCVPACHAADSPWNGTWKLNPAKSKMTGDTFTLAALPNGGFHLSSPSHSLDIDYPCDGTDYVVIGNRTGSCKRIDSKHYEMAGKLNGQPDWHGTSVVSPDGKYLTNTAHLRRLDGSDLLEENRFERVGTGNGRAGTWRNVKSTASVPDVMKIRMQGDTLQEESPAYKSLVTARLDGSAAKLEGPTVQPGTSVQFRAEAPNRVHYMESLNGKPMSEGTQTVSADGKTLTDEGWEMGDTGNKQVYVYEKQ